MLKRFLAALAACAGLGTQAGQYSDVWYDPQQPGWGVNVVQQLETAFVTLFVYDAQGRPTWYVASDARITAYSSEGGFPVFNGTLYRTTGPFHGGPYDPASRTVTPVGHLGLEVLGKDRIRVHYSADGVSGVKEVRRLTWSQPMLAANFVGQAMLRQRLTGGAPHGTLYVQADVLVHFDEQTGQGFMRMDDQFNRRCEFRGPYTQSGKLLRFAGTYGCNAGDSLAGTFELTDLEVAAHGISGYLRLSGAGLEQYGRFSALQY